jgi:hypothetical protein
MQKVVLKTQRKSFQDYDIAYRDPSVSIAKNFGLLSKGLISSNFSRRLNKMLRAVIQNSDIAAPRAAGSTYFVIGIPYPFDPYRQFVTLVYGIYNALDRHWSERTPNLHQGPD